VVENKHRLGRTGLEASSKYFTWACRPSAWEVQKKVSNA